MNNVVSLKVVREMKKTEDEQLAYKARILGMEKHELLEEMVRFQEERSNVSDLSLEMMLRGKVLFKALEESAETEELFLLTRSYRRHLEHELKAHYDKQRNSG